VDSVTIATPFTPGAYTGLEVWNAAVGGTTLTHQKDRLATMYPAGTAFDWLLVTGGHNNGTQEPATFITEVDAFVTAFKAAHPETLIVVSSQNPQFAPATTVTAHARRQAALRDYAMAKGYEYLPVFEAFTNQPDGGASLVNPADGVHPTVATTTDVTTWCGNLLWAAVWLGAIKSRRRVGATPPITGLP
jgi:lysophospholipase L1-like esterase